MSKRVVCGLLALAFVAALPGAGAAEDPPPRTAIVGIDFDPFCLNALLDRCNAELIQRVMDAVLVGAYRLRPDYGYDPVLVDHVDVETGPFVLTYHVDPEAVWSDGVPVTSDDFIFTLDTLRDPANATVNARRHFGRVSHAERLDAKRFRLHFTAPVAHWQLLFETVLPKHVLAGRDFDTIWEGGIDDPATGAPFGSGPFLLTARATGTSLTLTPNPRWNGDGPFLDAIVMRVIPSVFDQLAALRDGSLDLAFPSSLLDLAAADSIDGVAVEWRQGRLLEHLDFHVLSTAMPLLRETWFRRAVAYALDREGAAAAAWSPLISGYPALQSLSFGPSEPSYESSFGGYRFDPDAVRALMLERGCITGADGIWSCGGVRASVKIATTLGNAQRIAAQDHLVAKAELAGIELLADNSTPAVLLGTRLPARQFDSIVFGWVSDVGRSLLPLYGCGGASNFMDYCSPALDDVLTRADEAVDHAERAQLLNEADEMLAAEVPTLPLFARPIFLVRRETLHGPQANPEGAQTWNVEEWWMGPDETPPTIACTATPSRVWVHNGKLFPVHVDVSVSDDGSGIDGFKLVSLSSDEPGEGDVQGFDVGTPDTDGLVRAERDPNGDGRVYTFRYAASDRAGNTAMCEATVEIVRRGLKREPKP
ncbi:MAG: ABC transporter substrate-binding protein [Gaiellaceae bacterium]